LRRLNLWLDLTDPDPIFYDRSTPLGRGSSRPIDAWATCDPLSLPIHRLLAVVYLYRGVRLITSVASPRCRNGWASIYLCAHIVSQPRRRVEFSSSQIDILALKTWRSDKYNRTQRVRTSFVIWVSVFRNRPNTYLFSDCYDQFSSPTTCSRSHFGHFAPVIIARQHALACRARYCYSVSLSLSDNCRNDCPHNRQTFPPSVRSSLQLPCTTQ